MPTNPPWLIKKICKKKRVSDESKWSEMPKKHIFKKLIFVQWKSKNGYILKTTQAIIFIYITNLTSFYMNYPFTMFLA